MTSSSNIIVLDRDGVINRDSNDYIKSVDEWIPIERSIEAIARLKQAGFIVAIATNQSGIGRGYYDVVTLELMHKKLANLLTPYQVSIDLIVYCPHTPDEGCDCRKPKAGLLNQIEQKLGLSLAHAWIVGDSLRDLEAGLIKSMRPVLVRTGKGTETERTKVLPKGTLIFDDLYSVVDALLAKS